MFTLSEDPIDTAGLRQHVANEKAGAIVVFEGRVRNHNEGREVLHLDYEGSPEIAGREFARIEAEIRQTYDILDIACAHRIGRLAIGELAVWVGVCAAHRDAAFAAARAAIDEAKHRLPIWKKEHYASGDSGWIHHP